MARNKKKLLATVATADRLQWAKQLFSAAHFKGDWDGDYMLLAHEVPERYLKEFRDRGVLVKKCKPISNSTSLPNHPSVLNKFYLFTPEFKKWNNIVYLDSDIFIRASMAELAEGKGFAACQDYDYTLDQQFNVGREKLKEVLGETFNPNRFAFNSGMMAFSTDIITDGLFGRLKDLHVTYSGLSHNLDQPLFNLCFYAEWKKLSMAYNVPYNHFVKKNNISEASIKGIMLHIWYRKSHAKNIFHGEFEENRKMFRYINTAEKRPPVQKWSYFERKFYFLYLMIKQPRSILFFLRIVLKSWLDQLNILKHL